MIASSVRAERADNDLTTERALKTESIDAKLDKPLDVEKCRHCCPVWRCVSKVKTTALGRKPISVSAVAKRADAGGGNALGTGGSPGMEMAVSSKMPASPSFFPSPFVQLQPLDHCCQSWP